MLAQRELDAYVYERVVQIYNGVEFLVTHPKATRRGQRITRPEHYPAEKSFYLLRTRTYCQQESAAVGPSCAKSVLVRSSETDGWRQPVLAPSILGTRAIPGSNGFWRPDWIESGWRRFRPSRSFASMNTRVRRASSSLGTT